MNGYLKQSTASQVRTIGPFVDDTDFKTLKNALTIANTDIKIKKKGGASGSKFSGGATADGANGLYHLTWDATDTATVGELSVSVKVSGALVYFCTYTVLEEAVYDMLFGASATGYISDTTRASQTSVDAIGTAVDTEVAAILAAVDTEVGAIKAKTDNLPTDPADASDIAAAFAVTNGKIDVVDDFLDTEIAAIKAKTDQLTFTSGKVDANATLALAAGDLTDIADSILKRDWTAVSGEAVYSLLNAARMLRNAWATTGGVLVVKKEDGSTNAWSRPLAVDPTAQPIVGAS